jgi:hypothetical protein
MALALAIKNAKRRLFKRHREGMNLDEAINLFAEEMRVFQRQVNQKPPTNNPAASSPTRERNDLADAVAEILTNELAPPGLRDPAVNYVTDAPDATDETDETDNAAREILGHDPSVPPRYAHPNDDTAEVVARQMIENPAFRNEVEEKIDEITEAQRVSDNDPYKPTVLEPHAGRASVAEIERLSKASLGQGDDFDQHMALLELLTHLLPHDGSGWTMYARNAVVRDSTFLLDEAADVLIAREQHKRRASAPNESIGGAE